MGMYNTDKSIRTFARSSLAFALEKGYPCKFSTMNTTVKEYDDHFVKIFDEVYNSEFKSQYQAAGIDYEHRLMDDMVA